MRVYLGGEGDPIPEEALPDLTQFDGAVTLVLENGVPFLKADYVTLGYDAFEVWCIGAAGGSGGDAYGKDFPVDAPASVYAPFSWPYYITFVPGNPNPVEHYFSPFLTGLSAAGGGGGGGGLHRVAGLLADLPDSVPVVVGSPGGAGNPGLVGKENAYIPQPPYWEYTPHWFIWDEPHNLAFGPVTVGGDGGVSSFNGTLCRASGGKGGRPATKWVAHARSVDGNGGAGGTGGSSTAGGGAAGATSSEDQGATGSWDGTIGQGGGGGRGGHYYGIDEIAHSDWGVILTPPVVLPIPGTDGGLGSFSYGDTSVYGPRQPKQTIVKIFDGAGNPHWTFKPIVETSTNLGGGGGGGAHRDARKFGSRAVGYSPNGLVLIRLIKTG